MVRRGIVDLGEVDAESDGDVRILGRRRDDDLPSARFEMLRSVVACAEAAGRLDHDVDVELGPRELRRVGLGRHGDAGAVDEHRAVDDLDLTGKPAVDGVVPEQVSEHLGVCGIIDRHPLDVALALVGRAKCRASGAPEAIDCNANGHGRLL